VAGGCFTVSSRRRHCVRIVDTGAGKLTEPVAATPTDPVGVSSIRNVMSLRPVWTSANLMI
jgi:hypothetical protein